MAATVEEDKGALRKRFTEYIELFNTQDMEGLEKLYSDDAKYLPPEAEKTIGRQAILEAHRKKQVRDRILHFYFELLEVQIPVPNEYGFTSSISSAVDNYGRTPGKYKDLVLWKKLEDGQWYIYRHMYNNRPVH